MHAHCQLVRRGLVGIGLALLARLPAHAAGTEADAFPTFDGYIKISGQAPFISGDTAAFATRNGLPSAGAGGIEDLYYAKDLSKSTTLTANGHALAGAEDYLINLNLAVTRLGTVDAGYKRFRTFYDGVGGFFPLSNQFQVLSPERLHVDRGNFWASVTLAVPDRPSFKLTYRDETRTGQKDSSEWAAIINPQAVIVNGALVGTAPPANTPFTAPNLLHLDEHHQILEAVSVVSVGRVTDTLTATWDHANNDDRRNYVKYPGSTVTANPTVSVLDDQEAYTANSFRIYNQGEVVFNEHVAFDVGLAFNHVSTKIGGNWVTPAYSTALKTVYTPITAGNIYGGSKVDDYVGNAFLRLTPTRSWVADLGFRAESKTTASRGGFVITSLASSATTLDPASFTVANDVAYSRYVDHVTTPEVAVQYLGFRHVSIYGSFDQRLNHGQQHWINPYAASTTAGVTGVVTTANAPLSSVFFQDANQDNENAKLGVNWTAGNRLTIRAEVFRKDHENRFVGSNEVVGIASYGGYYANGYQFTGVKLSVIYRPIPTLAFNTRYQPQAGHMAVTANAITGGTGNESPSGKARTQMVAETIDWNPTPQLYFQGSVNVTYSYLQTSYPVVVVSTTTSVPPPILNADNNYVAASALCGFVIDRHTDAELHGYWTKADNFNPQVATGGQPYGASFNEQAVTAGLKHKLTDRLIVEGKAGYLRRTDATTGHFTDFHGPLFYVSLTCAL